jgi:hypothetical protein
MLSFSSSSSSSSLEGLLLRLRLPCAPGGAHVLSTCYSLQHLLLFVVGVRDRVELLIDRADGELSLSPLDSWHAVAIAIAIAMRVVSSDLCLFLLGDWTQKRRG